jgi:hypothetical protein
MRKITASKRDIVSLQLITLVAVTESLLALVFWIVVLAVAINVLEDE